MCKTLGWARHFPSADNSRELVAWVYPRRLPWLACTPPTVSSGRPRCGVALPPSASRSLEVVSEPQHPYGGRMRDLFQRQVLGSPAAVCPILSGGAKENHC